MKLKIRLFVSIVAVLMVFCSGQWPALASRLKQFAAR